MQLPLHAQSTNLGSKYLGNPELLWGNVMVPQLSDGRKAHLFVYYLIKFSESSPTYPDTQYHWEFSVRRNKAGEL